MQNGKENVLETITFTYLYVSLRSHLNNHNQYNFDSPPPQFTIEIMLQVWLLSLPVGGRIENGPVCYYMNRITAPL